VYLTKNITYKFC